MSKYSRQKRRLGKLIEAFDTIMLAYVGVASGVFSTIAEHTKLNPGKLASILDYERDHVEAYCKAATAYGLLGQTDDGFQLSKFINEEQSSRAPPLSGEGIVHFFFHYFLECCKGQVLKLIPMSANLRAER